MRGEREPTDREGAGLPPSRPRPWRCGLGSASWRCLVADLAATPLMTIGADRRQRSGECGERPHAEPELQHQTRQPVAEKGKARQHDDLIAEPNREKATATDGQHRPDHQPGRHQRSEGMQTDGMLQLTRQRRGGSPCEKAGGAGNAREGTQGLGPAGQGGPAALHGQGQGQSRRSPRGPAGDPGAEGGAG